MSQCRAVLLAEAQAHLLYLPEGVTWAGSSNNRLAAAAPKLPSSLTWSARNEVKKDRWTSCLESHHSGEEKRKKRPAAGAQELQLHI